MTPPPLPSLRLLRSDQHPGSVESPAIDAERGALRETIRAARSGDVRAFATLVDSYYARALRFALHMMGGRPDAEEAVQDAFVRVYRALPTYREEDAFEPWFFRILGNRCRTANARSRRHAQLVEYGDVPDRPTTTQHDSAIAWREEIERALQALPVDQREAFLMRHVEALSYEDMSVATGAGVSALKMRVKRACDALRVRLMEVDDV
jgi:RNA polymerase sigma-70 factor (ECF subfamily)